MTQIRPAALLPRSVSSLPPATQAWRGEILTVRGGIGIPDGLYYCGKNADETLGWQQLAAGSPVVPNEPPPSPSGNVYYVSPGGSDLAPGTQAQPWATLSRANSKTLGPGDAIMFEGGQTFAGTLTPRGSGTAGTPAVWGSYGTGKAIISGQLNPGAQHDVRLENIIVDGHDALDAIHSQFTGSGTVNLTIDGVEARSALIGVHSTQPNDAGWIVQNCSIHDTSDSGVISWGSGIVIQNSSIQTTGTDTGLGYDAHGVYSKGPGAIIRNNDIAGYRVDGVSTRYRNAIIEGNQIHDGAHGVVYYNYDTTEATGEGTTLVRYNRIWDVTGYGVYVAADNELGDGSPENWRIYNNTIVAIAGGSWQAIWYDGRGTELAIQNNIVTGTWDDQLLLSYTPTTYVENHNCWAGTGSHPSGTGDITADPLLSAAPDFVPQAGSPAINAGTTSIAGATFTVSGDGAPLHYVSSAPDMGAVETANVGGSPNPTLSPRVAPRPIGSCQANAEDFPLKTVDTLFSTRFVAPKDGLLNRFWHCYKLQGLDTCTVYGGGCYAWGTGGKIKADLHPDAAGVPNLAIVLGTTEKTLKAHRDYSIGLLVPQAPLFFLAFDFGYVARAGEVLHVVFKNTDPDPVHNGSGPDCVACSPLAAGPHGDNTTATGTEGRSGLDQRERALFSYDNGVTWLHGNPHDGTDDNAVYLPMFFVEIDGVRIAMQHHYAYWQTASSTVQKATKTAYTKAGVYRTAAAVAGVITVVNQRTGQTVTATPTVGGYDEKPLSATLVSQVGDDIAISCATPVARSSADQFIRNAFPGSVGQPSLWVV